MLAEQYSDMLAQDFRLRNVLLSSYSHTFSDLAQFDQRMYAYQEGMMLLKEQSSDYLLRQLQEPLSAGELFSITLFATNANDEFLLSGSHSMKFMIIRGVSRMSSTAGILPVTKPRAAAIRRKLPRGPARQRRYGRGCVSPFPVTR